MSLHFMRREAEGSRNCASKIQGVHYLGITDSINHHPKMTTQPEKAETMTEYTGLSNTIGHTQWLKAKVAELEQSAQIQIRTLQEHLDESHTTVGVLRGTVAELEQKLSAALNLSTDHNRRHEELANRNAELEREVAESKGKLATERYEHRATIDQRDTALAKVERLEGALTEALNRHYRLTNDSDEPPTDEEKAYAHRMEVALLALAPSQPEGCEGEGWHRLDGWHKVWITGGYRPLLMGEPARGEDEVLVDGVWRVDACDVGFPMGPKHCHTRTKRPLPEQDKPASGRA
jgi:hypothetical protein